MKRLIIIRGNSGSGKTTVSTELRHRLGRGTMLLSQDVIRRQVLRVKDHGKHPTLKLMAHMARFGWDNECHTVIMEGILSKRKNADGLMKLISEADTVFVYYFDIPFEETLRRHAGKPNAHEFGEAEMREWWQEKDVLGVPGEQIMTADMSKNEIIRCIVEATSA
jgi:adenylylsulfate kinase-like enzyme